MGFRDAGMQILFAEQFPLVSSVYTKLSWQAHWLVAVAYTVFNADIRVETILSPHLLNYNISKTVKPSDLEELINEIVLSLLGGGDNTRSHKIEEKNLFPFYQLNTLKQR